MNEVLKMHSVTVFHYTDLPASKLHIIYKQSGPGALLFHRRVTPSIKFAGTHLYTWVERGTVWVKCLAQEHNTINVSSQVSNPDTWSGVKLTNHVVTAPPTEQGNKKCLSRGSAYLDIYIFSH